MSRIGREPITVPAGVTVTVADGNVVTVKGPLGDPVAPIELSESQLPGKNDCQKNNQYVGKYVTLKGLTQAKEIFVLLYLDSNKDKKAASNRVFLSDTNGVEDGDLKALSELAERLSKHLEKQIMVDVARCKGNNRSFI